MPVSGARTVAANRAPTAATAGHGAQPGGHTETRKHGLGREVGG